ncbi:unnamed protein product, partial [Arabidopsis halleri]
PPCSSLKPSGLLLSFHTVADIFTGSLLFDSSSVKSIQRMSNQPAQNGLIPPPTSEPSKAAASAETKPKKRICC